MRIVHAETRARQGLTGAGDVRARLPAIDVAQDLARLDLLTQRLASLYVELGHIHLEQALARLHPLPFRHLERFDIAIEGRRDRDDLRRDDELAYCYFWNTRDIINQAKPARLRNKKFPMKIIEHHFRQEFF